MQDVVLKIHTFSVGSTKDTAVKILEEASETRAAWQALDSPASASLSRGQLVTDLADEVADTIQACCNLAARLGIDLGAAMRRCEERNRARGRYDGTGA